MTNDNTLPPPADRARGDGHPTCNGTCAGANPAVGSPRPKARRGFAAMPPATQRALASLGGKAAHARGTAHEFTTEEARAAGRKGGLAAQARRATSSS